MSPRLIPMLFLLGCGRTAAVPASHVCLDLAEGSFEPLAPPERVFGAGLTYAAHLRETGQAPGEVPPVFLKPWSPTRATVAIPSPQQLDRALDAVEPGLSAALADRGTALTPLLDYEVELGIAVLEDYEPGDVPRLGFFVANDLSERGQAVLGEGQPNRMAHWGASKGHDGFLPTAERMWVPDTPIRDALPCVTLETRVNGALRQSGSTADLVYPTSTLLDAVSAEQGGTVPAGTWILTGTPSGVAVATPAWKLTLADLAHLDRFQRLDFVLRDTERFLQPGDVVTVEGDGLGAVEVTLGPREP